MNDKAFFLNDEIISDLLLLNPKINNIDEFPNKLIVKPLALDRLIIFTKSFLPFYQILSMTI